MVSAEATALEAAAETADRAWKDERGKIWNRPRALSPRREDRKWAGTWNHPIPLKRKRPLPHSIL